MKNTKAHNEKEGASLFIVDTTFQLLNAIEAVNSLNLSRSFLVIMNEAGQTSRAYRRIIQKEDWAGVIDVSLVIDVDDCSFPFLGPRISDFVRNWCSRYLHFKRMRRAANIVKSFREVTNLFLGHYWAEEKGFMRHFANSIKHERLFLLDDGTDIIEINARRKALDRTGSGAPAYHVRRSLIGRLMERLRNRHWTLELSEAESITFFTAYALDIRAGDHLIANEYRYLRGLAGAAVPNDEIYFLGQCLVEDEYMNLETYLDQLKGVKAYFIGQQIKYVPHPRESAATIEKVQDLLKFEIMKIDVPIEYQLVTSSEVPRVIASFFCSALESCSNLFAGKIAFACFYLHPRHLKRAREMVEGIYGYFEKKEGPNFVIVRMTP